MKALRLLSLIATVILVSSTAFCSPTSVRVVTWNLDWFPSGSPRPASPEVEERRIQAAAAVLRSINPDLVFLQEMRDWETCERLAQAMAPEHYEVAVCSAFPQTPRNKKPGHQQVALLTKIPAHAAWTEPWKSGQASSLPRGFAFAAVPASAPQPSASPQLSTTNSPRLKLVGCYSLHLKSNLARSKKTEQSAENILKRELSARQLVAHRRDLEGRILPAVKSFVVAGDFNTDPENQELAGERTLKTFAEAGFKDAAEGNTRDERITHPKRGHYKDAIFDYVLYCGLKPKGKAHTVRSKVSDHWPLVAEFEIVN
jgi:endonuclease/exonuclease/phosphatase family metal-dependent hydrolase